MLHNSVNHMQNFFRAVWVVLILNALIGQSATSVYILLGYAELRIIGYAIAGYLNHGKVNEHRKLMQRQIDEIMYLKDQLFKVTNDLSSERIKNGSN